MPFATCSTGNTKTHKVYTVLLNGVGIYFQLNPHHSSETNEKPNQLFPFAVCPDTTKRLFNEIQGARSVKRCTVPSAKFQQLSVTGAESNIDRVKWLQIAALCLQR